MKKKALPKINIKEIKRVLKHMEENPDRVQMRVYGILEGSRGAHVCYEFDPAPSPFPPCHTQACFAGWARLLNTEPKKRLRLFDPRGEMSLARTHNFAKRLFGFTEAEAETIFAGHSLGGANSAMQLRMLKVDINEVLENRRLKTRV